MPSRVVESLSMVIFERGVDVAIINRSLVVHLAVLSLQLDSILKVILNDSVILCFTSRVLEISLLLFDLVDLLHHAAT